MKTCSVCGLNYDDEKKYCQKCGMSLVHAKQMNSIICENCQTSNPDDFRFCKKCGQEILDQKNEALVSSADEVKTTTECFNGDMYVADAQSKAQNVSDEVYGYFNSNPTADSITSFVTKIKEADAYSQAFSVLECNSPIKYKLAHELLIKSLKSGLLSKKQEYEVCFAMSDIYTSDLDNIDLGKCTDFLKKGISIANELELDYDEDWKIIKRKEGLWYLLDTFSNECIKNNNGDAAFEYCNEAVKYTDHPGAHLKIADIYASKKNDVNSARKHLEYIVAPGAAEYFRTVFKDYEEIAEQARLKIVKLPLNTMPPMKTTGEGVSEESPAIAGESIPVSSSHDQEIEPIMEPVIADSTMPGKVTEMITEPEKLELKNDLIEPPVSEVNFTEQSTIKIVDSAGASSCEPEIEAINRPDAVEPTVLEKVNTGASVTKDNMQSDGNKTWQILKKFSPVIIILLVLVGLVVGYFIGKKASKNSYNSTLPTASNTEAKSTMIDLDAAITAYNKSEYDAAIKLCQSILRRDPNNVTAEKYLHKAMEDQKKYVNNASEKSGSVPTPIPAVEKLKINEAVISSSVDENDRPIGISNEFMP